MSRLMRPMPFDPQAYECRPGYTLSWLCGVVEELAPKRRANEAKPLVRQRVALRSDRRSAEKSRNPEVKLD